MPEPLRSPKQSRVAAKSRSHPYTRPPNGTRPRNVDVERSNSLFGTLKTIVTAPLAWFSTSDSQRSDEILQKRRASATERSGTPPKAKRVRRESPQVVEEVGYLDPPSSIFEPKGAPIRRRNVANGITLARTMSLDPLPSSFGPTDVPLLPPSRATSIVSRMSMSVEPHEPSYIRRSITRDLSMPPPSPFARSYSRPSVAPFAPGASFGPSPTRRTRESTAPPLLGSSNPSPSFTRPPTTSTAAGVGQQNLFPSAVSRGWSEGPMSTLLEQGRKSVSPMRESPARSMLVSDEALPHTPGVAKAERTLSTLEAFRTPLRSLVSSSPSLVNNDRLRKVHVPFPSKLRFDHTPQGKRDKAKRVPEVIGPYSSGMSGMRKLLARRREELGREAETENETKSKKVPAKRNLGVTDAEADDLEPRGNKVMETDTDDVLESRQSRDQVNSSSPNGDAASPSSSPKRSKGDTYSSLRASSSKVHRSHASAPKLKKTRNKFSLDDEEEEQEWSMSVEELKKYQARTPTHMSFSTTRRMSETGMQTDTSADDVSRLPISSPLLPAQPQTFDSLLSRIAPSPGSATAFKAVTEFPAEPPKTESEAKAQIELASSSESTAPVKLPFSLGVSSVLSVPKPADAISSPFAAPTSVSGTLPSSTTPTPAAGEGPIPSFFANTKVQFMPPKVPSGSLFGPPPPKDESEKAAEKPPNLFGTVPTSDKEEKKEQQISKGSKPSPFGGVSKPSVFGSSSASPFGNASLPSTSSTTASQDSSPFSATPSGQANGSVDTAKPTFSFGASGASGTDATTPGVSIFGAASKQASDSSTTTPDVSTKPAFSFNALPSTSTATPPVVKPAESPSTAPSTDASSKPVFSFGAPASSSAETSKSLFAFGASSQPKASDKDVAKSPFSFGAAPSTPPPADKTSGFTFGVTSGMNAFSSSSGTTTKDVASAPTPEAPKSLFGGFGSIATPAPPSTPKPPESTTADNGDGMEVAADRMEESPTRTVEKKDTSAMQLPQTSPFAGFGSGSGSSTTPFSFGSGKAASTGNAFSLGQSKPGNGFAFGQSTNTSTTGAGTSTGFSFGASTKPTGQSSSPFGAPLVSAFGSTTPNPAPSPPFPFAQPSASTNTNPFGQMQQQENGTTTTAPSSPSLFPQPIAQSQTPSPSFSFNVPNNPSPFGAAKPDAAAPSTTSTQPFQFGAASSSQQQPQQQSGTPAANAPPMFTLGGAATTPRKVKGLPTRRGKRP